MSDECGHSCSECILDLLDGGEISTDQRNLSFDQFVQVRARRLSVRLGGGAKYALFRMSQKPVDLRVVSAWRCDQQEAVPLRVRLGRQESAVML